MVPPPERSARKMVRTASDEIECLSETRDIKPSSSNGMMISYPLMRDIGEQCESKSRVPVL
jgi:hypothetical protein